MQIKKIQLNEKGEVTERNMVTDKKTEVKAFICNVHPGDKSIENIFVKLRNSRRVLEASAISLKLRKMWFYFTLHKMVGQYVNCRLPNEFISKYYIKS